MKSTGVAVYKSQCSLSRMILSMRRISAVEKLHPLRTTRSLTEPRTCYRHRQRPNKTIVLKIHSTGRVFCPFLLRCCFWVPEQKDITSSSSLTLAARTSEVKATHFRYFVCALKQKKNSFSFSKVQEQMTNCKDVFKMVTLRLWLDGL